MEKDCGSLSGPSGVKECVHGLNSGAASVRAVRSRMANLKVPDCLRDVDAKLRSALGLLQDGYSKAQKGLVAWMRRASYARPGHGCHVFRNSRYRNRRSKTQ